jgi:hypothetical protein
MALLLCIPRANVERSMPDRRNPSEGLTARYLEDWLAHIKGRVRARTYQGYEGLIRLYAMPALAHLPLRDVGPLDLQSLYSFLLQERSPTPAMAQP